MTFSTAKKSLATLALGASLFAGATAANAAQVSAGGGTWDYGVSYVTMTTWSNYHHPTRAHGSTACNKNACKVSDTVPRDVWSKAAIKATWGGNTSYWR
ncbi:MAG TPA: lactococcin 972 family bacteriocin [Candidatus Rothia avistercoris]|uniref:Lactococcin 972 family bacteriocin n=1 Tax=Candidatus Rothia avistercoris TaxID=2840479 RepID=A0A9D2ZST4_9MICC|nr:lactococcin 972 family bacteriocin [Candidatus Rothia avistercoris]